MIKYYQVASALTSTACPNYNGADKQKKSDYY